MMNVMTVPSTLLRDQSRFWQELRNGVDLKSKSFVFAKVSVLFFGIYGILIGSSASFAQAISSGIKLPLLYLLTLAICFPTLHIMNLLFGARQSVNQLWVLLLATMAITSTLLLSFAPVSLFFAITTNSYTFTKLLNVVVIGFCSIYGVKFFVTGMGNLTSNDAPEGASVRRKILTYWIVLYIFVGTQLGWTLRPFFGDPNLPFEPVREIGGNFYMNILESVGDALNFNEEGVRMRS